MNIYNTVSWLFGYDGQPVVVQSQARDYLSNLPADILKVIMSDLPDHAVRALHLTERKIMPAAEAILPLRYQKFLETIICEKAKKFNYPSRAYFPLDNLQTHKTLVDKAETFPNGSNERLQALRNTVCSLYRGRNLDDLLSLGYSYLSCENKIPQDKLLIVELMKNIKYGRSLSTDLSYNDERIIRLVNQYFNLLETNQTSPKEFEMSVFNIPFHESSLKPFLGALQENLSINKVTLSAHDWNPLHVKAILEVINNNERIKEFIIRDIGSKRNQIKGDGSWVKSAKEQSKIEFEELIENELKDSFEFIERNQHWFLIYKRIG